MVRKIWALGLLGLAACDDEPKGLTQPFDAVISDAVADATLQEDTGNLQDAAVDAAAPDAARPPAGTPVDVDLAPFTDPEPGASRARAFIAQAAADLPGGPAASGRRGDYVLDNGKVRFVVEQGARVIGPCPYGGNLIDADVVRPEGEAGQDALGEACLFVHLAQTLAPDLYQILNDGSDGRAAVLAVTGHLELLDFINLNGLLSSFGGGALRVGFATEEIQPLTITVYYILRPGDTGVRVLTALRNDGAAAVHTPVGHLIDSGGEVDFFNPYGPFGGHGYAGLSPEALAADPLVMLGFLSPQGGHAYVPRPDPRLVFAAPRGGSYVTVSGVAVSVLGNDNVLPTLLARPPAHPGLAGIVHLDPGASTVLEHWHLASGGDPAPMIDAAWRILGAPTGRVAGVVTGPEGAVAGVRVSAIDAEGHTLAIARTGADGRYAFDVPVGTVKVRAWTRDRVAVEQAGVVVDATQPRTADVVMGPQAALKVSLRRPDGSPTPGKVTVLCDGACPNAPTAAERDVTGDGPIEGTADIQFAGMDGELTIPLAPGAYKVVASRGTTWSVWPADSIESGGQPFTLDAGEVEEITAEIAPVIDTTGTLSADFHVHALNSPDSPVPNDERVRTFLGEGVDVLVSTDHDYIHDFAPDIAAVGAQSELASVVGVELTTFDYGHYNGFPLARTPNSPNGGAFDWAGAQGPGKTPAELFAWFKEANPGEVVAQVNHPAGGFFTAVQADLLRGRSFQDPTVFRLPATPPDAVTGDTGLWDEGFTAFEAYNGLSRGKFWRMFRYWAQMVGRGFSPTATAVSDTHKRLSSQAGTPRSFVILPEGADTIAEFDDQALALAVNQGRLIGSGGPFFRIEVVAGEASAGPGDTLTAPPGEVEVRVHLQAPAWMQIDEVQLFSNLVADIGVDEDQPADTPVAPTATLPVSWAEAQVVEVAPGHTRRELTVTTRLPVAADAYIIAVVHGDSGPSMFPVIHSRGARPFAYSNPVFVDVDGGGYNTFPLAALVASEAKARRVREAPRAATEADLRRAVQETAHDH